MTIRTFLYRCATSIAVISAFAASFMMFKHHERNTYLKQFISQSLSESHCLTRDDTVMQLSRSIYRQTNNECGVDAADLDWYDRWESTSWFNMTSAVALKYGAFGVRDHYVFGPCGTMSRLLLNSLWYLNIPAQKLQLLNNANGVGGGHTLVEYNDAGTWKVIATSDSAFVWRNNSGAVASVDDIQQQAGVFEQIYAQNPRFPYRFDNPQHVNWTRFPSWLYRGLRTVVSDSQLRALNTPALYEQPRLSLFYLFALIFIASVTWSLQLRDKLSMHASATTIRASRTSAHRCLRSPDVILRSSHETELHSRKRAQMRQTVVTSD